MSSDLNVREYNNKEHLLFPPSIGDYLSEDHLAHIVDEAVEGINLSSYYKKISLVGNPSYHPALMIKIWFYGYATRTYSSRRIEEKVNTDVAFIYLAGMQKPNFKTISEFRKNNLKELKDSFVDILQICHRLGMTRLGEISIDSKVMKANASYYRSYGEKDLIKEREEVEKAVEEYLEKANRVDFEEDEEFGSDRSGNELPEDICRREDRIKRMKEVIEQLRQAERRLKSSGKKRINLTDGDAQFQKDKDKIVFGYRTHVGVDSKEQIIVATDVTDVSADQRQLLPMVEQVIDNVKQIKDLTSFPEGEDRIKILADSGYGSTENFVELEKKEGIDPYIPDSQYQAKQRGNTKQRCFDRDRFIYHKERDEFECIEGKRLHYVGSSISSRRRHIRRVYRYEGCKVCKFFGQCTTNKKGRTIEISEHDHYLQKMRAKLSTKEGKEVYGRRKTVVEPVLGNLSQNLGFKEFLLRGLYKVKMEFALMCIAHNLLKIARFVKQLDLTLKEALSMPRFSTNENTS